MQKAIDSTSVKLVSIKDTEKKNISENEIVPTELVKNNLVNGKRFELDELSISRLIQEIPRF